MKSTCISGGKGRGGMGKGIGRMGEEGEEGEEEKQNV